MGGYNFGSAISAMLAQHVEDELKLLQEKRDKLKGKKHNAKRRLINGTVQELEKLVELHQCPMTRLQSIDQINFEIQHLTKLREESSGSQYAKKRRTLNAQLKEIEKIKEKYLEVIEEEKSPAHTDSENEDEKLGEIKQEKIENQEVTEDKMCQQLLKSMNSSEIVMCSDFVEIGAPDDVELGVEKETTPMVVQIVNLDDEEMTIEASDYRYSIFCCCRRRY